MKPILINKGDTYKATLSFKEKGEPIDLSNTSLVLVLKKEGEDDEDAEFVHIFPEKSGKDGKVDIEIEGEEKGEYVAYIKSLDEDKRYTLTEIPVIIK